MRDTHTIEIDLIGSLIAALMLGLFVAFGFAIAMFLVLLGMAKQAVPLFLAASALIGSYVLWDIMSADI